MGQRSFPVLNGFAIAAAANTWRVCYSGASHATGATTTWIRHSDASGMPDLQGINKRPVYLRHSLKSWLCRAQDIYLPKAGWWDKKRRCLRFSLRRFETSHADVSERQIVSPYPTIKSAHHQGMKNGDKIRFRQKGNMAPGFLPGDIGGIFMLYSVPKIIVFVHVCSGDSKGKTAWCVPTQERRPFNVKKTLTSRSIVWLPIQVRRIFLVHCCRNRFKQSFPHQIQAPRWSRDLDQV